MKTSESYIVAITVNSYVGSAVVDVQGDQFCSMPGLGCVMLLLMLCGCSSCIRVQLNPLGRQ